MPFPVNCLPVSNNLPVHGLVGLFGIGIPWWSPELTLLDELPHGGNGLVLSELVVELAEKEEQVALELSRSGSGVHILG